MRSVVVHAYTSYLPEAIGSGTTEALALTEMEHALVAAVRGRIKNGIDLVAPTIARSVETYPVALPVRLAAKAAIYSAWKESGLTYGGSLGL
jgi:antitoxin HicB